jgi:hypothetical protein
MSTVLLERFGERFGSARGTVETLGVCVSLPWWSREYYDTNSLLVCCLCLPNENPEMLWGYKKREQQEVVLQKADLKKMMLMCLNTCLLCPSIVAAKNYLCEQGLTGDDRSCLLAVSNLRHTQRSYEYVHE